MSEQCYRVVFTASQRLKEKLERGSALLSHAIPPTDLPALLERALDLLIEREERRRYGSLLRATASTVSRKDAVPRPTTATGCNENKGHGLDAGSITKTSIDAGVQGSAPQSRHLPAELRRQVWVRDGGQCGYVDQEGRRCQSRHFLEFDHRIAHALGGAPTIDNIRMRCRAHNALAAEQVFGTERITNAITTARKRRHRTGEAPTKQGSAKSRCPVDGP